MTIALSMGNSIYDVTGRQKNDAIQKGNTHVRIDVHTHAQPPEYLDILVNSGRYEVSGDEETGLIIMEKGSRFLTITPQMHDVQQRIADMDRDGIDVQILSVTTPQVYFLSGQPAIDLARRCNDYLASIVQAHPDRFRALASIPLTANIDEAVRELVRCIDELGMVGFIIGANIDGTPIDDPRFDPFYEEANRLGTTMFIHPMAPAGIEVMNQYALAPLVGFMFDTTLAVSRLIFSNFFGRFLGIKVIVSHLGAAIPFLAGRLDMGYRAYPDCQGVTRAPSEAIADLYLDTVSFHEPALRCAIDTVGVDRILFGSDYPHVIGDVTKTTDTLDDMLGRRDKRKIFGDNAAPLFGLEVDGGSGLPLIGMLTD
jgi:aminocarboxymuconate-semialdehyde decarboxylase